MDWYSAPTAVPYVAWIKQSSRRAVAYAEKNTLCCRYRPRSAYDNLYGSDTTQCAPLKNKAACKIILYPPQ